MAVTPGYDPDPPTRQAGMLPPHPMTITWWEKIANPHHDCLTESVPHERVALTQGASPDYQQYYS